MVQMPKLTKQERLATSYMWKKDHASSVLDNTIFYVDSVYNRSCEVCHSKIQNGLKCDMCGIDRVTVALTKGV